jgi:hypothetical protein
MTHYEQRVAELQDVARDLSKTLECYAGIVAEIAVALELDPERSTMEDIINRCAEVMATIRRLEMSHTHITLE